MTAALVAVVWTLASMAVGFTVGKFIALDERDQPLTYDERQALIERSRRRHPSTDRIGPPREWLL